MKDTKKPEIVETSVTIHAEFTREEIDKWWTRKISKMDALAGLAAFAGDGPLARHNFDDFVALVGSRSQLIKAIGEGCSFDHDLHNDFEIDADEYFDLCLYEIMKS